MSKKKIVVCDHIHQKGIELLEKEKDIELVNAADIPKGEPLYETVSDADVVITRSSTDVDEPFLNAAKKLKAIVRAGVGVDNVDIEGCSRRGIIVMNVPTANTIAAVELTIAHMLGCMRAFPYAHNQLKLERIWKRENWIGNELKGKKLGIIGFGNIGSRVGVRALAFGMDVIAYDPYISPSKATDLGVKYTTNFDDILACDVITIHTPKTKETINMIDREEIAKMKDGVVLINCARGGLYNEDALYDGLKSGKIKFAGIDVFAKEPATDNKLLELDNVTVTPHLGANTVESQERIATQAATQAIEAARGVSYPNALNLPIKEDEIPPFVKPYLELTQKIGFLAAQVNKGAIKSIKVFAEGEIGDFLKSLTTFAVVGALKESLGEAINYVNAEFVAKERDISISYEKKSNISGYKNKIAVKLTTDKDVIEIGGTIFEENVQRIVEINNFALDVEPKGKMIFFRNTDVPGVIGDVGMILAKNNINIADFRLGRDEHGQALAVIIVDDDVDKKTISELAALKACISVHYAVI
ncbi:phosphoglycerate dehydrogenase [Nitrosophilus alvini]|uniref:phosphoglycerate dehydrogenase n=1 Tax=Nitrosophilus alvini TaxID=2714855 RepID=UPI00190CA79C|nr:phosphoglycerate dehydrogenase [Nitrosophilus alvini]